MRKRAPFLHSPFSPRDAFQELHLVLEPVVAFDIHQIRGRKPVLRNHDGLLALRKLAQELGGLTLQRRDYFDAHASDTKVALFGVQDGSSKDQAKEPEQRLSCPDAVGSLLVPSLAWGALGDGRADPCRMAAERSCQFPRTGLRCRARSRPCHAMSRKKPEKKSKSLIRLPESVPKTCGRPDLPRGISKAIGGPMKDAERKLGRSRKVH